MHGKKQNPHKEGGGEAWSQETLLARHELQLPHGVRAEPRQRRPAGFGEIGSRVLSLGVLGGF